MTRLAKGTNGPPLVILHAFYKQRMSVVFQKMQAPFSLKRVVISSEGSFKLTMLLRFLSLSFPYMLLAINGGHGT
jgi:hypothetical protein